MNIPGSSAELSVVDVMTERPGPAWNERDNFELIGEMTFLRMLCAV